MTAPRDYEPLDLTAVANTQLESLSAGAVEWHGLPFLIGERAIELVPGGEPVTIDIDAKVQWVLVAHVLTDAPREAPETLGRSAATYVFELDGGESVEVPIRDRFEIAGGSAPGADPVTVSWGHLPFAAVPTEKDRTPPRYSGPWSDAGGRQTETIHTWRAPFFLWPWRNPQPDRPLTRLTLRPHDRRLVVCAVTLSRLEESPFPRDAGREVLLSLEGPVGEQPFALEVDVDRGSAGFPFLLSRDCVGGVPRRPACGVR